MLTRFVIFKMYLVITFLLIFNIFNNVEASPIFDTIGTGSICNTNTGGFLVDCSGRTVGKNYFSFHQNNFSIANAFTVPSNDAYTLTSIEVPMSIERSPNNINIELRRDTQGSPGGILKSWNFIDKMTHFTNLPTSILVGTSSNTPEITLVGGKTYWLSSSATISDTSALWHTSVSNHISGTTANWNQSDSSVENWSVYQDSTLSAFRINGDFFDQSSQKAAAFGAWSNLIKTANSKDSDSYRNREQEFDDCFSDPSCDLNEFYSNQQGYVKNLMDATKDTLNETAPLVYDPTPIPTDKLSLLLSAKKIIQNGLDALSFFGDYIFNRDPVIESVSITGDTDSFEINPSFDRFTGSISADIVSGILDDDILGAEFFVEDVGLFDNPIAYGVGRFDQLSQGANYDRVIVSFSQIEANETGRIPLPGTMSLALLGIACIYSRYKKIGIGHRFGHPCSIIELGCLHVV